MYNLYVILYKEVIPIEDKQIELALYVIELKKAQLIKENKEKNFKNYKDKVSLLNNEKKEIYKGNEEIINKVLTLYLKEVTK